MNENKSQPIPTSLNETIYHFYAQRRNMGKGWHEIADEFNNIMSSNFAESSLRGRFQSFKVDENGKPIMEKPESLEIQADGTHLLEKVMFMDDQQAKTPEWVMEANGYDPKEWTVMKYKTGLWGSRDPESPFRNYTVSLELKARDKSNISIDDIVEANKEYKYTHKYVPFKTKKGDHAITIEFPDLHIGAPQSNIDLIKERLPNILEYAREKNVEKVYLSFLGDVLHVDSTNNATVAGTPQDLHMTAQEMYILALDFLNHIVYTFKEFDVEVYWVEGNHAAALEFALFNRLEASWIDYGNITFWVSDTLRKAYRYGVQMVGITHGHMTKKELFGWLADEYPEMWGKSKYREMHHGHIHQEKVEAVGGVINRAIPTMLDPSIWENMRGYRDHKKVIQVFLWNKKTGLSAIEYF